MNPSQEPMDMTPQETENFRVDLDAVLREEVVAAVPSGGGQKTILLVEDDVECRSVVKVLLEGSTYHVLEASDGIEGFRRAREALPDLVVADFNMPGMNGYEMLMEMKSAPETRKIPVLMLTGAPNRNHIKEIGLDVIGFLEKPSAGSRILDAISKALGDVLRPPAGSSEEPVGAPQKPKEEAPVCAPEVSAIDEEGVDAALLQMVSSEDPSSFCAREEGGLDAVAKDSPIIAKINQILIQAVRLNASDIHIEPMEKEICVRVRLDGCLKPLCSLPAALQNRLVARVKVMASLSITERRLPQDGQFRAQIDGKRVEFRVSSMPCSCGEKIVLRILGSRDWSGDLGQFGMSPRDVQCVEKSLRSPHGIILVTGPTGSGKTTTLYTMLRALHTPEVNIVTAEDPVEYSLQGITQVHVKPSIGLTFESALRAFLRQDPDVILVGEIRDKETAEIAMKAAVTGHLVLSTLHTNSAPATVARLSQMGLPAYLIAASVKMVIAQRLLRVLCPACRIPADLAEEDRRFLTDIELNLIKRPQRAVGCGACHQTGYAGRRPIFEVMPVASSEMRRRILASQNVDDLSELAVQEGMTSLRREALRAVCEGWTSLPEAMKIILSD